MIELLARCRALQKRHREIADELGKLISDLCWQMSQSVETSRPAPEKRQPAYYRSIHWTQERIDVLSRRYPTGDDLDDIHREVNALPGPFIPRDRHAVKAASLNLKRPPKAAAKQSDNQCGDGSKAQAVAPKLETKAAPAVDRQCPAKALANAAAITGTDTPVAERPSVSGNPTPPAPASTTGIDPANVRGKPGVWGIPVSKTVQQIHAIAERMHYELVSMTALPVFNRHRVMVHGLPPLVVRHPKPKSDSVSNDKD